MAAGLGFKTFTVGEVLSAADVNGYLMQGVLVFADSAARSAAITSPQEGQSSYLKDTDVIQVYSGTAWVTKSGGSSPLTTKGDLYTFSTSDARLAVGTNTHVLTADSAEATGLKWAAPASGGGMTSIASGSLSGSSLSLTSISGSYVDLVLYLTDWAISADVGFQIKLNNNTTANIYQYIQGTIKDTTISATQGARASEINLSENFNPKSGSLDSTFAMTLTNYANTTAFKNGQYTARFCNQDAGASPVVVYCTLGFGSTSAIDRIDIFLSGGATFTNGTYVLYGVK